MPRDDETARHATREGTAPTQPEADPLILAHTRVSSPFLCPGIRLHLVTEDCPLWRAPEEDLESLGIPSPFWAFCWAGGEALARLLLDRPELVAGRRVLDFGCGGGVEAMAAALAGADVLAADLDPVARRCVELNAALNGVQVETTAEDWLGARRVPVDCVLVGDVTYEKELAARVCAWLERLSAEGTSVLLSDPGRGCLPERIADWLAPVACYRAPADNDRGQRSFVSTTVYAGGPVREPALASSAAPAAVEPARGARGSDTQDAAGIRRSRTGGSTRESAR